MKTLLSSLLVVAFLSLTPACVYDGQEPVSEQESAVLYVLVAKNLKPTSQYLYVVQTPTTPPVYPSSATTTISRLSATTTELPLNPGYHFLVAQIGSNVLVPGVPGVDFTAVVTGI